MRRLYRPAVSPRAEAYLAKKQREIDRGADPGVTWTRSRGTRTIGDVYRVLTTMAGGRERCMYCEDSRGTDIDHFRPKIGYRNLTFAWLNLLLACSGCNRKKGDRFPTTPSGEALLIDPSIDDPWDHLYFNGETGLIVERWLPETRAADPKGRTTASDEYLQLNVEAVCEGRLRVKRSLERSVNSFLRNPCPDAVSELKEAAEDGACYGLTDWFFKREGTEEEPFRTLHNGHPEIWEEIVALTVQE
jgi:uncharacterized protein (TIGR02646 family)